MTTSTEATSSDYYFDGYSHFGIHEEMLQDEVRTKAYRDAILKNKSLFRGKTVLDIGCGTGILCLFAAKAGAATVVGLECAAIADHAKNIVKANGMSDIITIIKKKVEDVKEDELPVKKFDVIVSEWMGYFMIYESMLDTVLYARDRWLKPGGILLPDRGTLYFGAFWDAEYKAEKVDFWDSVYGFDMSCIKEDVLTEPLIDTIEPDKGCTKYISVLDIDLYTVKKEDLDFKTKVSLPVVRNEHVDCLVAYFDVTFSKCHKQDFGFSTGPDSEYTHWKQTVFYLDKTINAKRGKTIDISVDCSRNARNPRDLDILIETSYEGQSQKRKYMLAS